VAYGNRKGISHIVRPGLGIQAQQQLDHALYLLFVGPPVA
jgi:hypothetical protein